MDHRIYLAHQHVPYLHWFVNAVQSFDSGDELAVFIWWGYMVFSLKETFTGETVLWR